MLSLLLLLFVLVVGLGVGDHMCGSASGPHAPMNFWTWVPVCFSTWVGIDQVPLSGEYISPSAFFLFFSNNCRKICDFPFQFFNLFECMGGALVWGWNLHSTANCMVVFFLGYLIFLIYLKFPWNYFPNIGSSWVTETKIGEGER